jgi:hypothetical protein
LPAVEDEGNEAVSRVGEWARLADGLRQAHLQHVDQVQEVAEAGLRREVARRVARYGTDAAAVLEGGARLRAAVLHRSELWAEMARIDIPGGRAEPDTAVVYGRVVNYALEAVPAVNVVALDEGGATLATDTTDRKGYFRLEVRPGTVGDPSARAAAEEAAEEAPPAPRVVLMVSDAGGVVLYRDRAASTIPVGAVIYRDVLVAGAEEAETETERRVYHVTPSPTGGWNVQAEGATRPTSTHPTKQEAVARGREVAKGRGPARLIVHRKDGRIEAAYTYGRDQRPTLD